MFVSSTATRTISVSDLVVYDLQCAGPMLHAAPNPCRWRWRRGPPHVGAAVPRASGAGCTSATPQCSSAALRRRRWRASRGCCSGASCQRRAWRACSRSWATCRPRPTVRRRCCAQSLTGAATLQGCAAAAASAVWATAWAGAALLTCPRRTARRVTPAQPRVARAGAVGGCRQRHHRAEVGSEGIRSKPPASDAAPKHETQHETRNTKHETTDRSGVHVSCEHPALSRPHFAAAAAAAEKRGAGVSAAAAGGGDGGDGGGGSGGGGAWTVL